MQIHPNMPMMTNDHPAPPPKPVLQKPPGFRDPRSSSFPASRPPAYRKKPPLPQTFRQVGKPVRRRQPTCSCRRFCCLLFLLLFVLVLLLLFAGAVSYLYFQPRLPAFRLQSVQTPHFKATTKLDGGGTSVDAQTVVDVFASNQNGRISLSYGESSAAVYIYDDDGDVSLGSGSMQGFVQGRRNGTVLRFRAEAKGLLVDDAVGTRLRSRFRSKELRFGVQVRTGVGLVVQGKATWRVPIRVDCPPASLKQVRSGKVVLPKCEIHWLTWIQD